MRWSREMTNSRDSEVPRPEHRVPDRQPLSTLSPNTSQRFQQRQEAAFRHSHTAQLSLPSSHSRAPAQQPLPRSLCSRGSLTRPRTAKEPVPLTLSVAHSRGALTPTVFLLALWDFSVTHTGSPLHSLPRSFLFHTQTPSHLESCTLTKPSRVSLSLSRTHAPARSRAARASFSHHRPLRAPRSRRPPLSRGVSPAPFAPRGFRPASSTRRRRPSRALDRTRDVPDRNGTSPRPNRSQPLTSSPPPVSSRCPGAARMLGRAAAAAAQAPPTPRHSHRIATARAAWGPGSERGAPRRRCFRAPERAGALGDPRAAPVAPTDCDSGPVAHSWDDHSRTPHAVT